MTLFALQRYMLSIQLKSCFGMVERILVEPDNGKISPVMLFMAFNALFVLYRCVESFVLTHAGLDLAMACRAVVVRYRFSDGMTLRAIFRPFQMLMSVGQIARRDLSVRHT